MVLGETEASPKELADLLEENFHRVCEHVRILRDAGVIELVDEDNRRGGTQHIYKASTRLRFDFEEWAELPEAVQAAGTVSTLRIAIDDAIAALRTNAFDSHPRRALLQKPMIVDDQGFADADESALRHLAELEKIAAESAARLIDSGEEGIAVKTLTMIHPAAPRGERSGAV